MELVNPFDNLSSNYSAAIVFCEAEFRNVPDMALARRLYPTRPADHFMDFDGRVNIDAFLKYFPAHSQFLTKEVLAVLNGEAKKYSTHFPASLEDNELVKLRYGFTDGRLRSFSELSKEMGLPWQQLHKMNRNGLIGLRSHLDTEVAFSLTKELFIGELHPRNWMTPRRDHLRPIDSE